MENKNTKLIILSITILGIIFGIILGIYVFNKSDISETNMITEKLASEEVNTEKLTENETVTTSSVNSKISPNAVIIEKSYYKICDHLIREAKNVPNELINKTEDDVRKKYAGWKIEEYSPKEIIVYKEINDICNEHYIVKEHNGVIGIYTENKEGINEFQEDTQIETKYLPDTDIENLKIGVKITGTINLNNFLEDYE